MYSVLRVADKLSRNTDERGCLFVQDGGSVRYIYKISKCNFMDRKYCYIANYKISVDSNLNLLYVLDDLKNIADPISIFHKGNCELVVKIDQNQKVDSLIYQSDYADCNKNLIDDFKKKATEKLNQAINRLQTAFGLGLTKIYQQHSIKTQKDLGLNISFFSYESKITAPLISARFHQEFVGNISYCKYVKLQDIKNILKIDKENIDEYVNRFISLENLNEDPVLHLLTVFSLYEYIKETSDRRLDDQFNEIKIGKIGKEKVGKKNIQDKELTFKDKFICTRNLVAHGLVHEYTTVYNLEQILRIAPIETSTSGKKFYSFDRNNHDHINLINEVIGEVQPIIQKYLSEELELKE